MPKPIIYGTYRTGPVRAVLLVADAIGLDYDFKEVNLMAGDTKTEEFVKKNPQHTVPLLEDDGKYIWDSHAIITYLVGKFSKNESLYPNDLFVRAQVDQRLHFDTGVLGVRLGKLIYPIIMGQGGVSEEAKTSALEAYDFLEKFLGSNKCMVGSSVTVADFSIVASLSTMCIVLPVDPANFPKLAAWFKRMSERPGYEKANGFGLAKLSEHINMKLSEIK